MKWKEVKNFLEWNLAAVEGPLAHNQQQRQAKPTPFIYLSLFISFIKQKINSFDWFFLSVAVEEKFNDIITVIRCWFILGW